MSILDRIFDGVRSVVSLEDRMTTVIAQNREQAEQLLDHEKRLVRIETMIEMGGGRPPPRRLPRG